MNGLRAGAAAADQRQHRESPDKIGEPAEQGVTRTEYGAWADDGRARQGLFDR
jgi:hypothetical protein